MAHTGVHSKGKCQCTDRGALGAQAEADDKLRRELGWKASQENRLAWQEKLSNQQHERNRAVEGKLVEQQRKNSSDAATSLLLEARMRAHPTPVQSQGRVWRRLSYGWVWGVACCMYTRLPVISQCMWKACLCVVGA